jgi:hypothetical protein
MPDWYLEALADRQNPAAALAFANAFLAAPSSEQELVRKAWDPALQWALPHPWRLACMDEGPGSPSNRIRTDLVFQALSFDAGAPREAILGFAVVHNSAQLAGLEPRSLFEDVARAVSGAAAQALREFAHRSPKDQSLEAFRLTPIANPGGGWEIRADW